MSDIKLPPLPVPSSLLSHRECIYSETQMRNYARAAVIADRAARAETVELGDVSYEIWQDDMMVASSTCPKDASHYAAVYSQDGEVKVYTVIRRDWDGPSIPAAPTQERGAEDE